MSSRSVYQETQSLEPLLRCLPKRPGLSGLFRSSLPPVEATALAASTYCLLVGTSVGSVHLLDRSSRACHRQLAAPPAVASIVGSSAGIAPCTAASLGHSLETLAVLGFQDARVVIYVEPPPPPAGSSFTASSATAAQRGSVQQVPLSPSFRRQAFQLACGHRSRITSIAVSLNCQKVFVGDRGGTVSRTLVNVPDGSCESSVFLEEMSPVVKLEYCQRRLLVATEAQAAVYSDDGSCVWIVGGKRWETPSPLGACFLPDPSLPSRTSLLCAQPHWHLWLADLQGQVSASLALPQPSAAALRARPIPLLTPSRPLTEPDSKTNSSIRVVRIPSTRTVAMWNRAALHLLDLDSGELVGSTDLLAPLLDVVATEDGELMVLRAGSLYPQVVRLSTDQWSPAGRTQQRPTSMIEDESLAELPRLDERFNLQSLLDRLPLGERAVSQLLQSSADSASVAAAANIEFGEEAQEEEKPDNVEEPFDDFNDLADDNDELVVRRIVPKLSRHGPPPATVASPTPEPLAPSTSSASSAAERRVRQLLEPLTDSLESLQARVNQQVSQRQQQHQLQQQAARSRLLAGLQAADGGYDDDLVDEVVHGDFNDACLRFGSLDSKGDGVADPNDQKEEDPTKDPKNHQEDPVADPQNRQEDPKNRQEDPKNRQEDPKNRQEDPQNRQEDPIADTKTRQEAPQNRQENPQNRQEDPQNRQEDPIADPQNRQEDPQNRQEDPQNCQENPQNRQEAPQNCQENPQNRQEAPQNCQENPQNRQEDPKNRQENPQEPPSPSVALARLQWAVDDQPAASSLLHQSAAINPIQQLPSGPAKLELLKDQQTNRWWPHRCPEPLTSLCASAAPSLESGTALFATKSGSAYSARVLSNQGDARLRWQVESSLASVVSGDQLLQLQAAPPDLVLRLTASGRKLSAGRISGVGYRVSEWKTVREGVRCLGAGSARYLCGLDAGGGVFLVPMADVGQQLPGASVECPFRPASISIGQGHLVCMASQQQQHHHRHHQSAAPTELWAAPLSAPDRWWPIGRCSGGLLAALVTEFNLWTLTASGEGDGCCLRCWRGGSWLESEDLPALELWIAELDKPAHNKRSDLPWRVLTSALAGVGAVSDASAGAAAAPFIVSVPNFGLWLYWPDRDLLLTCSGPLLGTAWAQLKPQGLSQLLLSNWAHAAVTCIGGQAYVWAVGPSSCEVFCLWPEGFRSETLPVAGSLGSRVVQLCCGQGSVWALCSDGQLYLCQGINDSEPFGLRWKRIKWPNKKGNKSISSGFISIACSAGKLFGLGSDGGLWLAGPEFRVVSSVASCAEAGSEVASAPTGLAGIAGCPWTPDGAIWAWDSRGRVLARTVKDRWVSVPGPDMRQLSVSNGCVFAVCRRLGRVYARSDDPLAAGGEWKPIGCHGRRIVEVAAASGGHVICVDSEGRLVRMTEQVVIKEAHAQSPQSSSQLPGTAGAQRTISRMRSSGSECTDWELV
ncbi:hypothetical protein BOX15_Mlig025182g1 [Macrostomum lignano]|uniref:Tectonin beta-propeller repeat-containing protein 2 n=1 Tax=Macrostomum lignano TaxID=282301 RepID=A0A267ESY6_9PLAT|nr:hypothetical protein BOX15_Mlig025182g1 [Macrostomum lignano]